MAQMSRQRRHAVTLLCTVLAATGCALAWLYDGTFSTTSRVLTTVALALGVVVLWRLDTHR